MVSRIEFPVHCTERNSRRRIGKAGDRKDARFLPGRRANYGITLRIKLLCATRTVYLPGDDQAIASLRYNSRRPCDTQRRGPRTSMDGSRRECGAGANKIGKHSALTP